MGDDERRAEIEAVAAVILQGYEQGGTAGGVAKRAIAALDRVRDARGEWYPHVAEVRSLLDAIECELNDVGPWGNGYRQALADVRRNLDLRFGVRDARGECLCYGGLAFRDPMQHVPTCPARDVRGDDETPSIGRMGTKPSEMGHQYVRDARGDDEAVCACGERCWRVGGEAACGSVGDPNVRDARGDDGWAPNERQAVLDCINLYGDETLHLALDSAGLFPREAARSPQSEDHEVLSKACAEGTCGCKAGEGIASEGGTANPRDLATAAPSPAPQSEDHEADAHETTPDDPVTP